MDIRQIGWGGRSGVDSPGSGEELVAGCCKHGDETSGSGATELVIINNERTHLQTYAFGT
jgi:hypothetical protein